MPNYSINPTPWQGKPEWQEIVLFLDTIERVHGHALGPLRILARKIRSINEIKLLRQEMEATFCSITAG